VKLDQGALQNAETKYACKLFSRKKSNKRISPPAFNPRKGVKNVMSAKIPTGIVFVVLSELFSL